MEPRDKAFKKPTTFLLTEHENKLLNEIKTAGVDKITVLRRGILDMCDKLKINTNTIDSQ